MIHETRSIQETIDFLNEILKLDPKFDELLVEGRHPCNKAIADHPSIQVHVGFKSSTTAGTLGVLNGLFGADDKGWGPITAVFEDDGTLTCFRRTKHKE
jgi:hypothetical protein